MTNTTDRNQLSIVHLLSNKLDHLIWEACHHMIRTLLNRGETEAGSHLARMPERGETIRQLAYHLYTLCERKKWAEDARAYNTLVTSWHEIITASQDVGVIDEQIELDL